MTHLGVVLRRSHLERRKHNDHDCYDDEEGDFVVKRCGECFGFRIKSTKKRSQRLRITPILDFGQMISMASDHIDRLRRRICWGFRLGVNVFLLLIMHVVTRTTNAFGGLSKYQRIALSNVPEWTSAATTTRIRTNRIIYSALANDHVQTLQREDCIGNNPSMENDGLLDVPFSLVDDCMLCRNVTIVSVHWGKDRSSKMQTKSVSKTDTLLHIYRGSSFAPSFVTQIRRQTQSTMRELAACFNSGQSIQQATQFLDLDRHLSRTILHRMERWNETKETSTREQINWIIKIAADLRATARYYHTELPLTHTESKDSTVRILYVDDHICVVNKPSGVLAVPGPRRNPSLCEAVYNLLAPTGLDNMDQMVVHRLDMDTSGVLVFALSKQALTQLHQDFRERRVHKTYQALLSGHFPQQDCEIDVALERDPDHPPFMRIAQPRRGSSQQLQPSYSQESLDDGAPISEDSDAYLSTKSAAFHKFLNIAPKPSLTDLRVEEWTFISKTNDKRLPVTRVTLIPHTGRTHQLRVHTASLGYPIVGDDIYGIDGEGSGLLSSEENDSSRLVERGIAALQTPLCLHAHRLCIQHPIFDYPMMFQCDAPF